jgi:hypothetical protein
MMVLPAGARWEVTTLDLTFAEWPARLCAVGHPEVSAIRLSGSATSKRQTTASDNVGHEAGRGRPPAAEATTSAKRAISVTIDADRDFPGVISHNALLRTIRALRDHPYCSMTFIYCSSPR